MWLVFFSWCIVDGRQPHRILSTVSCIFSGAGVTEWMGRLYPRRFPREDVDFDSSAVSLCGEVNGWGKLSFSWGVINVLVRSTRKFMAISSNEAMMCQPSSHGSPAMGACSKQVVCHGILSRRKEHHYKKTYWTNRNKFEVVIQRVDINSTRIDPIHLGTIGRQR